MNTASGGLTIRVQELEEELNTLREENRRLKDENRKWAKLAGTHGLTGLPNKISFLRALVPQAIHRAFKEQNPVGFVLISADEIGNINEARGREAGDEVIRGLGEMVTSLLDETDRVGHLDGTHFAVIIYPSDAEIARGRANMIRARVRAHEFPCSNDVVKITVSCGAMSVLPQDSTNGKELADRIFVKLSEALYNAKKEGGNRVEIVSDRTVEEEGNP